METTNPCSCFFERVVGPLVDSVQPELIIVKIFDKDGDVVSTFSHNEEKPGCWYNVDTCEELSGPLHAFVTSRYRGWIHNLQFKDLIAPFQRLDS